MTNAVGRCFVLDNEGIGALRDPHHAKHRTALAHVEAAMTGKKAQRSPIFIPTVVRVEAKWSRTAGGTAGYPGTLKFADEKPLDSALADIAARLHLQHGKSVTDCCVAATALRETTAGRQVAILTSDPQDLMELTAEAHPAVTIVTL